MELITVDMEKPLTMKKLEELLSNSQVKASFQFRQEALEPVYRLYIQKALN